MQGVPSDLFAPELVSPLVVYLVSDACALTGQIFVVGGGLVARAFIGESEGAYRNPKKLAPTPEWVGEQMDQIMDTKKFTIPGVVTEDTMRAVQLMQKDK